MLKSQGKGILSLGRRAPRVPGRGALPWTDVATGAEGILIDVSPDADHTASVAINGSADVSIVQGPAHDLMSSHGL